MSAHLIFLVHGMGIHQEGWSKALQRQLADQYHDLEWSQLYSWGDHFRPVEIRYDDAFDAIRTRWQRDSPAVVTMLRQAGLAARAMRKLERLRERFGTDGVLQTHVLDVLMYHFIATVREAVKASVARQMVDALAASPPGSRWSVIAHSLGTAVTHDTLHALGAGQVDGAGDIRRAHLVVMLANVSRTLQQETVKTYASRCRPALPGGDGMTAHYLNVRHRWDPIPARWPFSPHAEWPDPDTRDAGRYMDVRLTRLSGVNPHGFDHHLRDPGCFVPLLRFLGSPGLIPEQEARALDKAFARDHPQGPRDALRRRLDRMMPAPTGDWGQYLEVFRAYFGE